MVDEARWSLAGHCEDGTVNRRSCPDRAVRPRRFTVSKWLDPPLVVSRGPREDRATGPMIDARGGCVKGHSVVSLGNRNRCNLPFWQAERLLEHAFGLPEP